MATNKHASIRYQALDKCFANRGRKYFINDLVEVCNQAIFEYDGIAEGVKKRQVQDDIKFMESESGYAIDIERLRIGKRVYYRYVDASFSINKQPLNPNEEAQLREAILTLNRFKGMPQFEWMDELTVKLEAELGLNKPEKKVIEFEQNFYLRGLEYISILYNSIIYKETLLVAYKSFKSEDFQKIAFIPYYLKQYNNRWFVFGQQDDFTNMTTLALDRIEDIQTGNNCYKASGIDFEEQFEDIIGVSIPQNTKIEKILLKVDESLFPYIHSKPLHGSQKIKESNDHFSIIELTLYPNYELESLLLSFGEKIEILQPLALREKLKDRLKIAVNKYKI